MICDASDVKDPVERAIQKHILAYKWTFGNKELFLFDFASSDTILKESVFLANIRPTHSNNVAIKTVKANAGLFSNFVSNATKNLLH